MGIQITEGEKRRMIMKSRFKKGLVFTMIAAMVLSVGAVPVSAASQVKPKIEKVEVVRRGKVRRAKLNYLRDRVGKAAKVKEATRR